MKSSVNRILVRICGEGPSLGRPGSVWDSNIKLDVTEGVTGSGDTNCTGPSQDCF